MDFFKYQGCGNDFVLIDNRKQNILLSTKTIALLCNRHFGIGADGLIVLEDIIGYDFKMVYYNADGNESTMCGNGGRCIVAFAQLLHIIENTATFIAVDGVHTATISSNKIVNLNMQNVDDIIFTDTNAILNTGSPHYVKWVEDVDNMNVYETGKQIRYASQFSPAGINVNFVQIVGDNLLVRTYERGVEDETLSCGTGVTASAIASTKLNTGFFNIKIETKGGNLEVSFCKNTPLSATNIVLSGPASFVYKGNISI